MDIKTERNIILLLSTKMDNVTVFGHFHFRPKTICHFWISFHLQSNTLVFDYNRFFCLFLQLVAVALYYIGLYS